MSCTYERKIGKGKKAVTLKLTSWSIRANVVRKRNRVEKEPKAVASGSNGDTLHRTAESADTAPF